MIPMHCINGLHDGVMPTSKHGFCSPASVTIHHSCYVVWFFLLKEFCWGAWMSYGFFLVLFLRMMLVRHLNDIWCILKIKCLVGCLSILKYFVLGMWLAPLAHGC